MIIIIVYFIGWICSCYSGYQMGKMAEYCEGDAWGDDEGTPVGYLLLMLFFWWLFIILLPIDYYSEKINNYFYKKMNKNN